MRAMALRSQGSAKPWRLGCLVLFPLLVGCGGPSQGKVLGRVLLEGTPLPGGRVTFRPADAAQNTVSAELDEQGNFQVVLPVGEVQVCVDNRELEPPVSLDAKPPPGLSPEARLALGGGKPEKSAPQSSAGTRAKPPGRYRQIPERYYDLETAKLQFRVERGEQQYLIELTK